MTISIISPRDLHAVSGDATPVKPPVEPILDELRKLSRDLMAIRLQMDKHHRGSKTSQEWQMIGIVIDRLLFGLYIGFISVSFTTILCLWTTSNAHGSWPGGKVTSYDRRKFNHKCLPTNSVKFNLKRILCRLSSMALFLSVFGFVSFVFSKDYLIFLAQKVKEGLKIHLFDLSAGAMSDLKPLGSFNLYKWSEPHLTSKECNIPSKMQQITLIDSATVHTFL